MYPVTYWPIIAPTPIHDYCIEKLLLLGCQDVSLCTKKEARFDGTCT